MAISETREYDDDLRLVTIRDSTGIVIQQRPYTVEENSTADAKQTLVTNETTLTVDAKTTIVTLQQSTIALQAIIDKTNANIGPADTKDLAREVKTIARQVLRLTRLQVNALDSATV